MRPRIPRGSSKNTAISLLDDDEDAPLHLSVPAPQRPDLFPNPSAWTQPATRRAALTIEISSSEEDDDSDDDSDDVSTQNLKTANTLETAIDLLESDDSDSDEETSLERKERLERKAVTEMLQNRRPVPTATIKTAPVTSLPSVPSFGRSKRALEKSTQKQPQQVEVKTESTPSGILKRARWSSDAPLRPGVFAVSGDLSESIHNTTTTPQDDDDVQVVKVESNGVAVKEAEEDSLTLVPLGQKKPPMDVTSAASMPTGDGVFELSESWLDQESTRKRAINDDDDDVEVVECKGNAGVSDGYLTLGPLAQKKPPPVDITTCAASIPTRDSPDVFEISESWSDRESIRKSAINTPQDDVVEVVECKGNAGVTGYLPLGPLGQKKPPPVDITTCAASMPTNDYPDVFEIAESHSFEESIHKRARVDLQYEEDAKPAAIETNAAASLGITQLEPPLAHEMGPFIPTKRLHATVASADDSQKATAASVPLPCTDAPEVNEAFVELTDAELLVKPLVKEDPEAKPVGILKRKRRYGAEPVSSQVVIDLLDDSDEEQVEAANPDDTITLTLPLSKDTIKGETLDMAASLPVSDTFDATTVPFAAHGGKAVWDQSPGKPAVCDVKYVDSASEASLMDVEDSNLAVEPAICNVKYADSSSEASLTEHMDVEESTLAVEPTHHNVLKAPPAVAETAKQAESLPASVRESSSLCALPHDQSKSPHATAQETEVTGRLTTAASPAGDRLADQPKDEESQDPTTRRHPPGFFLKVFDDDDPDYEKNKTYAGGYYGKTHVVEEESIKNLPKALPFVQHLTEKTTDPVTGLPIWRFAVQDTASGHLHCFTAFVADSLIPGAGHGAFLKFTGAYKLRKEFLPGQESRTSKFDKPLFAATSTGRTVKVKITGDSLRYRVDRSVYQFQKSRARIDLGVYGPLEESHLKPDDILNIKSFIYCAEPNDWGFHTSKKVNGMNVAIDVTDDFTGEPAEVYRREILMYVNEVGHNKKLARNVHIREDSGEVRFSLVFDKKPLMNGVPIELLTNYGINYEEVRERRGYGYRNLKEGLPSNESHSAQLERNFLKREEAKNTITTEKRMKRLRAQLHFVVPIWKALSMRLFASVDCDAPTFIEGKIWVAALRIAWLVPVFRSKMRSEDEKRKVRQFADLEAVLDEMERSSILLFQKALRDATFWQSGAVVRELKEEILYELRSDIPLMLDERMFCPLGQELLGSLCRDVANNWRFLPPNRNQHEAQRSLRRAFLQSAVDAKKKLMDRHTSADTFQFASGIPGSAKISGPLVPVVKSLTQSEAFFFQHTTISKGLQAVAFQFLKHHDSLSLIGESPPDTLSVSAPEFVVMAPVSFGRRGFLWDLASVPVQHDAAQGINTAWYLYWQIIWVAASFATRFLDAESHLFLVELCHELDADANLVQFCVERGVRNDTSELKNTLVNTSCTQTKRNNKKKKQKSTTPVDRSILHSPAELIYEGEPNTKFPGEGDWPPGWRQKTFRRTSGSSKGGTDHYWFPPDGGRRLRSNPEILRYLAQLR